MIQDQLSVLFKDHGLKEEIRVMDMCTSNLT